MSYSIVNSRFSVETASWYPFDTGMCLSSGGDQLLKIWDTNSMTPVDDFQFSAGVNDHSMSACPASAGTRCLVAVATQVSDIHRQMFADARHNDLSVLAYPISAAAA